MSTRQARFSGPHDPLIFRAISNMTQSGDRLDPDLVMKSYVDMGHITRLMTRTSQYLEGRRGTGKTHLLTYFAHTINLSIDKRHEIATYVDARELMGETPQQSPPPQLYAQKMLQQLIISVARRLREVDERNLFHNTVPVTRSAFEQRVASESQRLLAELQRLAEDGVMIPVGAGTAHVEVKQKHSTEISGEIKIAPKIVADLSVDGRACRANATEHTEQRHFEYKLDYSRIRDTLEEYLRLNDIVTLYIIVDEWSSISAGIQPHMAEYIKRCLFPSRSISLKIGVIPLQTHFHATSNGQQIGFERNGDIFRALNLDDDLVCYGSKCEALKKSFLQLLVSHVSCNVEMIANPRGLWGDEDDYFSVAPDEIPMLLTDAALERLLVFSMGNPRDFLNLFRKSFFDWRDLSSPQIALPNVDGGAKQLGIEKMETVRSHGSGAFELFQSISRLVFYEKRTNAFLIRERMASTPAFLSLIHHRALHVWDRSYSSPNHAGERFVVVSIDFCIVVEHLKAPNYRANWSTNKIQIEQLSLFFLEPENPRQESLERTGGGAGRPVEDAWTDAEVVRVLQSPDKRAARYVVLPDSLLQDVDHNLCAKCRERFLLGHPIVVKYNVCPKCAEPLGQ